MKRKLNSEFVHVMSATFDLRSQLLKAISQGMSFDEFVDIAMKLCNLEPEQRGMMKGLLNNTNRMNFEIAVEKARFPLFPPQQN